MPLKQLEKCYPPDATTILNNLCNVLQDEEGCSLIPRQLILLSNFFSVTKDSVMIADLELISRVLEFLSSRVNDEIRYKDPLLSLITRLKYTPKLSTSSDSLFYIQNLVSYFSTLGNVLHIISDPSLQLEILDILHLLLNRTEPVGLDNVRLATCIHSAELSYLPEKLSDFLVVAEPQIVHPLLNVILRLCILSELACWEMLVPGIHETLFIRLTPSSVFKTSDISLELFDLTLQILWKLFTCTQKQEDWAQIKPLSNAVLIRSIRNVLVEEMCKSKQPGVSKENRNSFAAILNQCMILFPNAEWIESGLVEDIIAFAVADEKGNENSWVRTVGLNNHDDFQFKKLMLAALTLCPKSVETINIMEKNCVTLVLVKLLNPGIPSLVTLFCSSEQIWNLFECTLDVISDLFETLHQSFLKDNLLSRFLAILEMFCNESYITLDIVFKFVRTIYRVCLIGDEHTYIKQELRRSNAIFLLFRMCKILSSTLTTKSQTILSYCLTILVCLICDQHDLQEQYGDLGMDLVKSLSHHLIKPTQNDFFVDNKLLLVFGNFIWEIIVWYEPNALKFIREGHVYFIPDILVMPNTLLGVKHLYLSLLVDLCTYSECIPYMVTWRCTQTSENLVTVLCKLWREEEFRMGVRRSKENCLSDIEAPLMGREQYRLSKQSQCLNFQKLPPDPNSSPVILDVVCSIRPKISALLQILNHQNSHITTLSEQYYHLGNSNLTPDNQVTLKLIEAYLPLKMGEIWSEYEQKTTEMPALNKYIVSTLATRYRHWGICIQSAQYNILRENNYELKQEEDYYSLLKSCHLTSALEALREIMFITRTSNRKFLLRAKEKQEQEIKILTENMSDNEVHKTYAHDINITTLDAGRTILLKYAHPAK